MKRETKGLLKERFIMKNEKDLGTSVTETVILAAATVIIAPIAIAGVGAILGGVGMIGQGVTNVVKDQIDKRKKKVEEVEED